MNEQEQDRGLESFPWEQPVTRRRLLAGAAAAGGAIAGASVLASGAAARPGAATRVRRRSAASPIFVANYGDMQNLDVHTSSSDTVTGDMLTNFYSIPVTFQVPPALRGGIQSADVNKFRGQSVESWKWNPKGTEITFAVRKGIKFPDGTPLDAAAIKASLDRSFDVKAVGSFLFAMVGLTSKDQIAVLDGSHVKFTLPKPTSLLFGNMAMFYGSAILNPALLKANETTADPTGQGWLKTHTAESGPYMLKDWNVGSGWKLEANPNFWEPVKTKELQFQVIQDAQQRELLIKSGKVDMALGVPLKDVDSLRKDPNLNVLSIPSRSIAYAGFNSKVKPFDNKLVRQAISYAVPYDTIMREVMKGQGVQLKSPIPKGTPYSDFSYWNYNTDYDKAKGLLAKAGYPKGFSTELNVAVGNPVDEQTAAWIQQGLQKIGVDVSINKMPVAAFVSKLQAKQHTFWFSSTSWISINNDPFYHLYWLFSQDCCTYGHYQNPQVVSLVNRWVNEPLNNPGRIAAVRKAQKIIVDDAPWLFMFQPPQIYVLRKNLKGFVYYSSDNFIRYDTLYKT